MASAFPLLGIVYTMMAETITETAAEERKGKAEQLNALSELARQTHLPIATLRRAITSGSRLNPSNLITTVANRANGDAVEQSPTQEKAEVSSEVNRPITGQFVTVEDTNATTRVAKSSPITSVPIVDGNPDKLQMTIEALRAKPDMTDEALAEFLALKRPASARFWRLKAIEILNAPGRDAADVSPVLQSTAWGNGKGR
jgi:hypothetical protein